MKIPTSDQGFFRHILFKYGIFNKSFSYYLFTDIMWRQRLPSGRRQLNGREERIKAFRYFATPTQLAALTQDCQRFYGKRFVSLLNGGKYGYSNGLCLYLKTNKRLNSKKAQKLALKHLAILDI